MGVWNAAGWSQPEGELERVVLERVQVAARTAVCGQLLRDAKFDVRHDVADRLIVQLQSYVLAEHLADHTDTATVQVPASWWDHWKHDHQWAENWSLRIFWSRKGRHHPRFGRTLTRWLWLRPAAYHVHTLTTAWTERAVYPYANPPLPDQRLGPMVLWRTASSYLDPSA